MIEPDLLKVAIGWTALISIKDYQVANFTYIALHNETRSARKSSVFGPPDAFSRSLQGLSK